MTAAAPPLSTRRRWIFRIVTLLLVLGLGAIAAEAALRILGGYRLFSVQLEARNPVAVPAAGEALQAISQRLVSSSPRNDLDPRWMSDVPTPPQRAPVDPERAAREARWRNCAVHYVFNAERVRRAQAQSGGVAALLGGISPDWLMTFEPDDGQPVPGYRFPASSTLPDGLVLNQWGWRGRDIPVAKPAGTVRIACVGASTTVSNHDQPLSWTQILEHWLNLWAARRGSPLRYEVLNLGREGITSDDIAAVVETEALPFAPDFILYMEGANQFAPQTVVHWEGAARFREPPADLLATAGGAAPESALRRAGSWSALARRLSGLQSVPAFLAEPAKPAQEWRTPCTLDESHPDLAAVRRHDVLGMSAVLQDLERIHRTAQRAGSQLLLSTFPWVVHADLHLDPHRHAEIFHDLNRMTWPLSWAHLRRAVDLQQAIFAEWARTASVPLLDLAARMPREPDLFIDGIHDNQFGSVARAWCLLEALAPVLETSTPRTITAPPLPASLTRLAQRLNLR